MLTRDQIYDPRKIALHSVASINTSIQPSFIFTRIRLETKMAYRCYIRAEAAQSLLSSSDRFYNRLHGLISDGIVSPLLYRYFSFYISSNLYSYVHGEWSPIFSPPIVRSKFHWQFFPWDLLRCRTKSHVGAS